MDILAYLVELLQQRKQVSVTDLGTFFKKKFPGRYDKETQSFLPPSYALQFTAKVESEQELPDYVAKTRNISVESASYYIAQFVNDIQQKLETEHEAELENLGRLYFTEHEGLSFEASKNINYGSEFYGLPALAETVSDDSKPEVPADDEKVFDEIAEAPATIQVADIKEEKQPVIENIELDEVRDDLKNTLKKTEHGSENSTDVPEFIREQHTAHPNRFGHTPEDEEAVKAITHPEVEVPESVLVQHEHHPERFGHTPEAEVEVEKTYLHLEEETNQNEKVVAAPDFIQEQHAEYPNRFGHDPLQDEPYREEEKPIWPKVVIVLFALLLIGVILYFIKPEWFRQQVSETKSTPIAIIDTQKVAIDSLKLKKDSIAKTDSTLKANQVGVMKTTDTAKARVAVTKPVTAAGKPMFHVIAVSYKTEAAAQQYIKKVKKIGLNATIANMEGTRKKVSIASFDTKEEAERQKDILQKRLKGEGFYVKEIKNNTQP